MEPALLPSASAPSTPQRLVSPILREFPMYTKIMEILDQAPRDGDHGTLVNAILRYEKLLLSFVGSSAKIHDCQCLLGIQIQEAGGKARVVATQTSPDTWTAKQALEVMDVITLYKVADALALAKGIAPLHSRFPSRVPLTKAVPEAAKSVVDKLFDVGALIKAFKRGISKIASPSFDEGHVIPSVGLLKALHRLDDGKNIMKIQRNFLLVAATIAYMSDYMRAPQETTSAGSSQDIEVDGAEVPDVAFQQFDRRLDQNFSKEEIKYLEQLNKLGIVALRFPLQLALFLSPLVLLIAMALEKKMFDRNHLIRLARALGTDRPPSVLQMEKSLWETVFALIKNPSASSKVLENLANALPDEVPPEAADWFRERLTVFLAPHPPIAPTVPAAAVPQRGLPVQNTQDGPSPAAVHDASRPKTSSSLGTDSTHGLAVNEQASPPVVPGPAPLPTSPPRLRDLDQHAGEGAVNFLNPSPPPSPCPDDGDGDVDSRRSSPEERPAEQAEHHGGDETTQQDVEQEEEQEKGPDNEDVRVDKPNQLDSAGKGKDEQELAPEQEAKGLVQEGQQEVNMDVDEEVNQPEAHQEMDVELDGEESAGNHDADMDVDEEPDSEQEAGDRDHEENGGRPHSDPAPEASGEESESEEEKSEKPLRKSSRLKNSVPPQPDPASPKKKPRREPKSKQSDSPSSDLKPKPAKPKPAKPKPAKPKPAKPKELPSPGPSKRATSIRKLGRSSTRNYDVHPDDFDPEPAPRFEGNPMFLITPDGFHVPVTPKMNLPEDLECLESFYDAVITSYKNGRPLHSQIKPRDPGQPEDTLEYVVDERSCFAHYPYEEFSKATTRELQEVFRHKHIMVTGCPYEEHHFDEDGVAYLEKRMNSVISAHDHSIRVEDGDYSVQEIKLTFSDFIAELHKPDGHILNALNFPLSMHGARVTELSTCVEAFTATKGRLHCPDEVPFPTADFNWALSTHAFSHHLQHMDTAGVNTLFEGNCGCKWVVVARRPLSAKTNPFASNSAFGEQFAVEEPRTGEWEYEAVLLRPGDMFFMRANTIHFVFTPENAIFHGSHFYTTSTLRETLYALTHCLMGDVFLTNTSHPKGILLLLRILHFCHESFIVWEPDFDTMNSHLPDLRTMDGFMDLVHLCSIVLFFNVLDPRTYQLEYEPNSLSEERYWLYDRNGVTSEDRLSFAYARGLAYELLDWVDATFILEAPPGSTYVLEEDCESTDGGESTSDSFLGCREFFAREALHHGLYIINYRKKVQTEDQERRRQEAKVVGQDWVGTGHEHPEQLLALPKMTCANVEQQVAWALLTLKEITLKRWEQALAEVKEVHYMVADQEQVKYTPRFREDVDELDASWEPLSTDEIYELGKTQGDRIYFVGQSREFSIEPDHQRVGVEVGRGAEALRQFKKRYAIPEAEVPFTKRRRTDK